MHASKHSYRTHANTAERAGPDVSGVGEGDLLQLEIAFPAHICWRHTLESCKNFLMPEEFREYVHTESVLRAHIIIRTQRERGGNSAPTRQKASATAGETQTRNKTRTATRMPGCNARTKCSLAERFSHKMSN